MMGTIATRRLIAQAFAAGEAVPNTTQNALATEAKPATAAQPSTQSACSQQQLARRFAAGDVDAAQQVIDTHQAAVSALVQRMIGWSGDQMAADITQEVFVKALVARESFSGISTFKTWLTRIAINECRAHIRKQNRRDNLLRWWRAGLGSRSSPPPEVELTQTESSHQVRRAIGQLPAKLREVVVLHYLEELSVSEIAEVLKVQSGAISTRLTRAREKLKTLLQKHEK